MYRIMTVQSKKSNYASLYQYMTTTVDGITSPLEIETKADLDAKIQKMLNEDGYSKDDFIIVQAIDYTIDATDYSDDEVIADADNTADTATDEVSES